MYGIPNCDTIKKARVWLEGRKVAYAFHDYRASGLEASPSTQVELDAIVRRYIRQWQSIIKSANVKLED